MNSPNSTPLSKIVYAQLAAMGSTAFAASQRRYALRGKGTFLGVRMADVRAVAKRYYLQLPDHSIDAVHHQCEALFSKNIYELKTVAIQWADSCSTQAQERHMETYGRWLHAYVDEWMECDDLCTHPVASLLLKCPDTMHAAKSWAKDDYWAVRRASAVSLVPLAKKGLHIDHVLDIAELLHKDEDRLVQKGLGWLLRVARKHEEGQVLEFMEEYKRTMAREIVKEVMKR